MLRALLVLCAALGVPGPALGGPGPVISTEQLASELAALVESYVSSATGAPLLRIAETLTSLQASVTELSARLEAVSRSQQRLEQQHAELVTSLSAWQQSHDDGDRPTAADRTPLPGPEDGPPGNSSDVLERDPNTASSAGEETAADCQTTQVTTTDAPAGAGQLRPPRITKHPVDTVVLRHDVVTLHCEAEGRPPPEIRWYKDGHLVDFSSHRVVLPQGSLFFLTVQQNEKIDDAGDYWCVARNAAGQARSHNATLTVTGPGAKH